MNMTLIPKKPKSDHGHLSRPEPLLKSVNTVSLSRQWKRGRELTLWKVMRSTSVLGLVVAIPTGLGMATGIWIDTLWPGSHSWFSTLAPVGFCLGCLTGVFWTCLGQKTS